MKLLYILYVKVFPLGATSWIISRIRTFVPLAVGVGIVWVERKYGVNIDDATTTAVAVGLVTAAYYEVARRLERRWPKWGWLLGFPAEPTY